MKEKQRPANKNDFMLSDGFNMKFWLNCLSRFS